LAENGTFILDRPGQSPDFQGMSRAGPQPLFHGVSRQIAEKIQTGEYAPGERLPSERWLGETLGVSRTTVRRAISELLTAGTIQPRGRAMYVAHASQPSTPGNTLLSLTELARSRGLTPSSRVLLCRVRPADMDEAEVLRMAPGADLFELERLRLLDGAAIAIERDRMPLRVLPNAMEIDFATASLYASLSDAGHAPVTTRLQIEAKAADETEAKLLDLPLAAPILVATERTSDEHGQTFVLGYSVYRSDRHRFLTTFHMSTRKKDGT
jgi:GntR family transcriptional regulator